MLPVVTQEKMMTSSFEVVNDDDIESESALRACGCAANEKRTVNLSESQCQYWERRSSYG